MTCQGATHFGDLTDIHDGAPVNAPELIRIERFCKAFDASSDKRLTVLGHEHLAKALMQKRSFETDS